MGFIGNKLYYESLLLWIQKPLETNKLDVSCLCFIIGNHGIGKTYGIQKAIEKAEYNIAEFHGQNYKDFIDFINKKTTCDIVSQINGDHLNKKVIFIDELESFMLYDRTFLNNLTSLLESKKLPAIKIIIAGSLLETKSALKISNSCFKLELSVPSESDILLFLKQTYGGKNGDLLKIAESCDGNISIAITLVNGLNKKKKKQDTESNKHDKSISINDIYNINDIETLHNIIDQDRNLHPLRFHENLIKALDQRKGTKEKKAFIYTSYLRTLIEWDIMLFNSKAHGNDTNIGTEYILYNMRLLYSIPLKKNSIVVPTEFTKIFNYLSLKKKTAIALYNYEMPFIGNLHKNIYENMAKKFSI